MIQGQEQTRKKELDEVDRTLTRFEELAFRFRTVTQSQGTFVFKMTLYPVW